MALWRRFGSAGFGSVFYRGKRWFSVTPVSGAPSAAGFGRLRGFRVLEQPFPASGPLFCYTHFRYYLASGQAKPKPKADGKGGDWRKPNVETDAGIRINEAINEREVRLVTDQVGLSLNLGVQERRWWMSGFTLRDKMRNEYIRERVGVASVVDKVIESRFRWFGYVKRRPPDDPVKRVDALDLSYVKKGRGRLKKT